MHPSRVDIRGSQRGQLNGVNASELQQGRPEDILASGWDPSQGSYLRCHDVYGTSALLACERTVQALPMPITALHSSIKYSAQAHAFTFKPEARSASASPRCKLCNPGGA